MMQKPGLSALQAFEREAKLDFFKLVRKHADELAVSELGFAGTLLVATRYVGVAPEAIVDEFGFTRSAVKRWISGRSVPHVELRRRVIEWLANHLAAEANRPT